MKKLSILGLVIVVGCATSAPQTMRWSKTRVEDGKVFLGPRYRGEGVYVISMAEDGLKTDSIVVRPKKGVIEFDVGLLNGYDRDVFVQAHLHSRSYEIVSESGDTSTGGGGSFSSYPRRYFGSYELVKPSYYEEEKAFLRFGDFVYHFTIKHDCGENMARLSLPVESTKLEMTFGLRVLYSVVGDPYIRKAMVEIPVHVLPEKEVLTKE